MLLVTLTLLLKLVEPSFGNLVGNSIYHPLGEVAHYVETVDEEDICHILLHSLIEPASEYKSDND